MLSVDPGKVVVIERDAYFNNVCRELLKTYDQGEVRRLRIDTVYSNAISLMYRICNQAFAVTRG
jgi:adenylate cyclase class IV